MYTPSKPQLYALTAAAQHSEGLFSMDRANPAAEVHLAIAGLIREDWAVREDNRRIQLSQDIADSLHYAQRALELKQYEVAARSLTGATLNAQTLGRKRYYITDQGREYVNSRETGPGS